MITRNMYTRHLIAAAANAAGAIMCAASAQAQQSTAAGSQIENTASIRFPTDAGVAQVSSNTVTLTVARVVDAAITAIAPVLPADATLSAVGFDVSNPGNAAERYTLAVRTDVVGTNIVGLAQDSDGNGSYDAAKDAALTEPSLPLDAGQRRTIFVLVGTAGITADVTVTATATAARGAGAPGTVLPGRGTDGETVVGGTGARAQAQTVLTVTTGAPSLVKSQTIVAPDGSSRAVPGAIVTYQLVARFPRAARAPEVTDAIPAGVDFVAGSVTLDGQPLSDAADTDAGRFDGTAVQIALGDIAVAGTRIIRFQTKIR